LRPSVVHFDRAVFLNRLFLFAIAKLARYLQLDSISSWRLQEPFLFFDHQPVRT